MLPPHKVGEKISPIRWREDKTVQNIENKSIFSFVNEKWIDTAFGMLYAPVNSSGRLSRCTGERGLHELPLISKIHINHEKDNYGSYGYGGSRRSRRGDL